VLDIKEKLNFGTILVRAEKGKTREAISGLQKVYEQVNPGYPFTYSFMDEDYQEMYQSEDVISGLSNIFGFLAIFISCLGLLGLTMFSIERRTKEIGIRKVLGATIAAIFNLLTIDFLRLITLSFVIAVPVAAILMQQWLKEFAYRINISLWIFILAGFIVLLIALMTISLQVIKAAMINPVNTLRAE
jgi:ABC-type antimicrobial peptide transport system permease subunit